MSVWNANYSGYGEKCALNRPCEIWKTRSFAKSTICFFIQPATGDLLRIYPQIISVAGECEDMPKNVNFSMNLHMIHCTAWSESKTKFLLGSPNVSKIKDKKIMNLFVVPE